MRTWFSGQGDVAACYHGLKIILIATGRTPNLKGRPMPQDPNALIWIDLEMSGLNTETDKIIASATIVTDSQLNILAQGPVLAVHQPHYVLNSMDDWNPRLHGGSGLTQRV